MAAAAATASMEVESMAVDAGDPDTSVSQLDFVKHKVQLLRDSTTMDFEAWVSLIRDAEETSTKDTQVISLVYDSFLSEFPLCYGYWIKYAAHKARVCTCKEVVEIYEQAVQAVTHSVDLWVSYCSFCMLAYEDPADIRRLFERALSLVGKDYLCHHLWDKYIEFEYSQKQWKQLATIYINTLKFPTKKLHRYYESFKKLVMMLEQEATHCDIETSSEAVLSCEVTNAEESDGDISTEVTALFDHQNRHLRPDAVKKYLLAGERFYQRSIKIDGEISCFESHIKRTYFHVKPLDDNQLENWHQYLDFVEKHGDFDWAVKLYERCLIPCANYSEFWIRYVEFVDAKGGREIANYALGRASSCFIKGVPTFQMYCAMFKEQIGDALGARSLFVEGGGDFASDISGNINRVANMEKRMGNTEAASKIYETAIENAMQKQNLEILPDIYTSFAQFKYAASGSIGDAKEVFVKGIKQAPCKPMIKGLIQFMSTHGGPAEIPILDSVVANAITPGSDVSAALSSEDREDISLLFLEFVDLYGSIQELRKSWARHSKLFPRKTRNLLQYSTTESMLHDENKRRRTESSTGVHDATRLEISKAEPSSKSNAGSHLEIDEEIELQVDNKNTMYLVNEHIVVAEEQQTLGRSEVHPEVGDAAQECIDVAHNQDACSDKSKIENQMDTTSKQEISQDLSSCGQNDQSTKSPQAANQKSPIATSNDCNSPSKAITCSKGNDSQDRGKTVEVSASGDPGTLGSRSNLLSWASSPKERSPSSPVQTSPEVEEKQQLKVQVKLETNSEHDISASSACTEKSSGTADLSRCGKEASEDPGHDHIQASEPQQLSVHAQNSSLQAATTPSNPWGSQSSANIVVQQTPQAQGQHQMAGAQIYQSNNFAWAGHAIQQQQQQGLMYAMPQIGAASSPAQTQLFLQPLQGNQQYFQSMQGYAPQMWQYYQQQLYYLQVQQNQQMQNLQQQQLPTEHLQQKYIQQVQQLNQQMVLWQQQVQQQQQQQQPSQVQQQPDQQQGQHHPSLLDTKQEQSKQQQQESQMEHQSQHLQQQQQQLYFQQQQQMYLMQQQQQLYLQQQQQQQQLLQQQLMQQQQYLSQLPQQQQDLVQQKQVFEQQQQQLFQQQQQQMLLLQQQQQQFLQQQMQQQLQQQANPPELKAQNYNVHTQHARNQQVEHGQETEASQSEGSKLRNAEQSESSYPLTPQSQRSNQ